VSVEVIWNGRHLIDDSYGTTGACTMVNVPIACVIEYTYHLI